MRDARVLRYKENVSNFNLNLEEIFRSLRSPRTASIALKPRDYKASKLKLSLIRERFTWINKRHTMQWPILIISKHSARHVFLETMLKDKKQRIKRKQRPKIIETSDLRKHWMMTTKLINIFISFFLDYRTSDRGGKNNMAISARTIWWSFS